MSHYNEQREADGIWKNAPVTATHYGGGFFWRMHASRDGWETYRASQWFLTNETPLAFKDYSFVMQPITKPHQNAQDAIKQPDPVNHPKHYAIAPGVEAIDIIKASLTPEQFEGYLLGNFLKYRLRAGDKDDLHQDIAKSNFYKKMLNAK